MKRRKRPKESPILGDAVMHSQNKECNTVCTSQLTIEGEKTKCTFVVKNGIKDVWIIHMIIKMKKLLTITILGMFVGKRF